MSTNDDSADVQIGASHLPTQKSISSDAAREVMVVRFDDADDEYSAYDFHPVIQRVERDEVEAVAAEDPKASVVPASVDSSESDPKEPTSETTAPVEKEQKENPSENGQLPF